MSDSLAPVGNSDTLLTSHLPANTEEEEDEDGDGGCYSSFVLLFSPI